MVFAVSDEDRLIRSVSAETTQPAASTTLSACSVLIDVLMSAHGHQR